MKHAASRELFRYWTQVRGERIAPDRDDVDPAALRTILADAFVLEASAARGHPFRIAGTRTCALFCRELKGARFTDLFSQSSRPLLDVLLCEMIEEACGLVLGSRGDVAGRPDVALELVVLPLTHRSADAARFIGTMVPLAPPYWLGAEPLRGLDLTTFRNLTAGEMPPAARAVREVTVPWTLPPPARSRPHLTLVQGGRSD